MDVVINDRESDFLKESTRERTPEGFLRVRGRVARSGIQRYYGCELGLKDKPFKLVSLYRPKDVVLSDDVCKMFNGVDITNNHPDNFVNSNNYRNLTSGVVLGNAYKDPENDNFIMCDMLIKDAETIKALEAGKCQLSVGYRNEIDPTSGVTPDGESYDAKVSKITLVNHVALVSRARAGFEARVFDSDGDNMKTVKLGDQELELQDAMADAIQQYVENSEKELETAKNELSVKDSELGSLTAKIDELEAELEDARSMVMTDEDLQQVLFKKESLVADARKIAGDDFVCDSFDSLEIMKMALEDSDCEIDLADKSEDFVEGYFRSMVASANDKAVNKSRQGVAKAMMDACKNSRDGQGANIDEDNDDGERKSAEQREKDRVANAWRGKKKEEDAE